MSSPLSVQASSATVALETCSTHCSNCQSRALDTWSYIDRVRMSDVIKLGRQCRN
jgi:hypothetical protein